MITMGPSAAYGIPGAPPRDLQPVIELINKYIVSTAQLTNRFAAFCDQRLSTVARQMYQVECQIKLLEYKLDSTVKEDGHQQTTPAAPAKPKPTAAEKAAVAGAAAAPAATRNMASAGGSPPSMPPKPPGFGGPQIPHMPGQQGRAAPPPPPGAARSGPPLPPGAMPSAGGMNFAAGSAMVPPPMPLSIGGPPPLPMLLAPPPLPPGPPPPTGNFASFTIRTHPKLRGYFSMQQAGVPAAAIKAKMQADGYKPEWFDTPDSPSPIPTPKVNPADKKTLYDSD